MGSGKREAVIKKQVVFACIHELETKLTVGRIYGRPHRRKDGRREMDREMDGIILIYFAGSYENSKGCFE